MDKKLLVIAAMMAKLSLGSFNRPMDSLERSLKSPRTYTFFNNALLESLHIGKLHSSIKDTNIAG